MSTNVDRVSTASSSSKAREIVAGLTDLAPVEYIRSLDANVEKCLPQGCTFQAIYPSGSSYWSRTAAISVLMDGQPRIYFLKLGRTDTGLINYVGEFTSIQIIHTAVPGFSPTPIAVGTYASDSDVHFYLASFVDMTEEVPEVEQLAPKLAELHLKTPSPNGKFGFPVPTCMGACAQPNVWTSSWERCFTRLIGVIFEFEQDVHGEEKEMRQLYQALVGKVIPRLLRPLETGGRYIQPCFVHGVLWDGNASIDADTDQPVIFDSSGSYAHNEYDLGAWNQPRHKIYRSYIAEYQRHFPPSAPEEDYEDRLILYRLRFNLTSSACYLESMRFRTLIVEDMKYLTDKYKYGYDGSCTMKGES